MMVRGDERVAFVGKTSSGKTFAAEALANPLPRMVVLDPKGMLRNQWGLTDWDGNQAKLLAKGKPCRIRVPAPFDGDWEPYLKASYFAGGVTVYIDEVYGVVPPGRNPSEYLTALYTRGRELGIGVWAATQRPSKIPLFVLSEAEWSFVFRLLLLKDRQRMQETIGRIPEVPAKDDHGFWLYHSSWNSPIYYPKIVRKEVA